MRVVNFIDNEVYPSEMKDGDIAVITEWPYVNCIGTVVQRYKDILVALGEASGKSWTTFFKAEHRENLGCMVKILSKGTLLKI